jgi:hypothetical protein
MFMADVGAVHTKRWCKTGSMQQAAGSRQQAAAAAAAAAAAGVHKTKSSARMACRKEGPGRRNKEEEILSCNTLAPCAYNANTEAAAIWAAMEEAQLQQPNTTTRSRPLAFPTLALKCSKI